ncbi:MAG: 3-phosphoshikimate 1-carboxyvinyltransferase [Candidatus Daviesbacteria bacterium]|nr:3-phosphoshikimate 1-carboxyvinyltransferase [Candidatus Daviesbacteria bacterium]
MKVIELKPLSKPAKARVEIPGSKSYTNRALFIAAMAISPVKILKPLISDDTKAMINCLRTLGVKIVKKRNCLEVFPNLKITPNSTYNLNANLSGTTIRFMLTLSTVIPGIKILRGKEGLNKRPIKELVSGLTQLGAKIEYLKGKGYPPVKVTSSKLNPGIVKIKGSISSQYISALLMIAPKVGKVTIEIIGNQISKPYIGITVDIIKHFGVKVENKKYKNYLIPTNQKYNNKQYLVEGDLSSAAYFLAIAALTKSTIALDNVNPNSKQADMKFVKILEDMGNKIVYGKNKITIIGKGIKPININLTDCPDQVQTLAVLASFARGTTKISGISSLKIKETDRVFALRQELDKMGIKTSATKDTLTIYGGSPKAAKIETYGDHRMAMAFAVAGAKLSGMKIIDPEVVNKTFPAFWEKLKSIGVKTKMVNYENIVLIGMRGSGKTTVAKLLSQKLNKPYVELDQLIVKRVGLTIPEIVEKYGWDFFRDKESEAVQDTSLNNGKIISTGGGVVTRPQNVDALKKNGLFIFLNASLETLIKRVGNNSNRPALTNRKTLSEEIEEILKQRNQLYRESADEIIDTNHLNPVEVTDKIITRLKGVIL